MIKFDLDDLLVTVQLPRHNGSVSYSVWPLAGPDSLVVLKHICQLCVGAMDNLECLR